MLLVAWLGLHDEPTGAIRKAGAFEVDRVGRLSLRLESERAAPLARIIHGSALLESEGCQRSAVF